jgi:hypothetical protein
MKSYYFIPLLFFLNCITSCGTQNVVIKEVHVIPKNFHGVVMIIQNQKQGEKKVTKHKKQIYNIPANGILITQSPQVGGIYQIEYSYETNNGRYLLKYYMHPQEAPPGEVCVLGASQGTYGFGEDGIEVTTYLVGTKEEVDSLGRIREKMDPKSYLK